MKSVALCTSLVALTFVAVAHATNFPDERVLVVGQQARVTEIPYSNALTASKAIIAAGGYGDFSRTPIYLVRSGQPIKIDMDAVIVRGQREKDVPLKPWDIIVIGTRLQSHQ